MRDREMSTASTAVSADADARSMPRVLNLGSGTKRIAGALNVDISADAAPDLVMDLGVRPWPLPRDWFQQVHAFDVLEHVPNVLAFIEELHAVCAPDASIHITVPHFSHRNAFTDPTHLHYFGLKSFDYFIEGHELGHYTRARFRKESVTAQFEPTLANKLVWRFARRFPDRWEGRWAWVFPAHFLDVHLRVVK